MRFLVWLTAGIAGGVLGGMGMGGGTVLIPILTIFCGVPQHMAQSVNLLTFLPMSALSLRVHSQNGLLDTKGALWMMVPATVLSALGAVFVQGVASGALRVGFGIFLCLLSLYQFYGGWKSLLAQKEK
ncbi:MAG TPA: TSUP family transporter [Candidatus Borkfalkia faecipullorum]|uniref:Probable membrane transporter protein n=1 Tax=Candidatus Borkfalkia faecipullorum TaxID=2838510 RepID=A0A9D1V867_9FIRM|nr:TSUP family transporter [Candidatus Borkfalkia faecipullorum]